MKRRKRWEIRDRCNNRPCGFKAVCAHTKSEARAVFKKILGNRNKPLPRVPAALIVVEVPV